MVSASKGVPGHKVGRRVVEPAPQELGDVLGEEPVKVPGGLPYHPCDDLVVGSSVADVGHVSLPEEVVAQAQRLVDQGVVIRVPSLYFPLGSTEVVLAVRG